MNPNVNSAAALLFHIVWIIVGLMVIFGAVG